MQEIMDVETTASSTAAAAAASKQQRELLFFFPSIKFIFSFLMKTFLFFVELVRSCYHVVVVADGWLNGLTKLSECMNE